jgi:hypothetical protein
MARAAVDRSWVQDVSDHLYVIGGAYYFDVETLERADHAGLDGLEAYVLGRGGVLGDVHPQVVVSALGYFNPSFIEDVWSRAIAKMRPADGARLYREAAAAFARRTIPDSSLVAPVAPLLEKVVAATDSRGLPFYAAHRSQPLPEEEPARCFALIVLLREWRGAAHLAAIRLSGLDPKIAHFLRRPHDMELFGWGAEEEPELSDEDRAALRQADEWTDQVVGAAYGVLDQDQRNELRDGLQRIEAAIAVPMGG